MLQASENSFESRGLGKEGRGGGNKKKRNLCPRHIPAADEQVEFGEVGHEPSALPKETSMDSNDQIVSDRIVTSNGVESIDSPPRRQKATEGSRER